MLKVNWKGKADTAVLTEDKQLFQIRRRDASRRAQKWTTWALEKETKEIGMVGNGIQPMAEPSSSIDIQTEHFRGKTKRQ